MWTVKILSQENITPQVRPQLPPRCMEEKKKLQQSQDSSSTSSRWSSFIGPRQFGFIRLIKKHTATDFLNNRLLKVYIADPDISKMKLKQNQLDLRRDVLDES